MDCLGIGIDCSIVWPQGCPHDVLVGTHFHAQHYDIILLIRADFLDTTQKFGLLTIRQDIAIRKVPTQYPKHEDTNLSYHQKFMTATLIRPQKK